MTPKNPAADQTYRHATDGGQQLPVESRPSIRPTAVWLVAVLVAGVAVMGYTVLNPELFGGPAAGTLVLRAVALVTVIGVVRFAVRILLLKRTTYVIDEQSISRQYNLFYKTRKYEVPLSMVRSTELEQSRVQRLFGYGTIVLNQGLGTIRLDNIPDPEKRRQIINYLLQRLE